MQLSTCSLKRVAIHEYSPTFISTLLSSTHSLDDTQQMTLNELLVECNDRVFASSCSSKIVAHESTLIGGYFGGSCIILQSIAVYVIIMRAHISAIRETSRVTIVPARTSSSSSPRASLHTLVSCHVARFATFVLLTQPNACNIQPLHSSRLALLQGSNFACISSLISCTVISCRMQQQSSCHTIAILSVCASEWSQMSSL